ncbi:MAG: hypothetical protein CVT88_04360 [Candidatus Altiarchaeales archaeon HGW-Altiarchaeales-1]|nr:MAG: hypothetical protein CVT88_04360 [Candidatus Altiarchaeales archaeon HGW-Altiarchaeales-1]
MALCVSVSWCERTIKRTFLYDKKIYSIDNGFVYSKGYQFKDDFGKLYENIVAIELKKLEMNNIANIYYWKNSLQEEVDFVVKRGIKIEQLIQVCYNIENAETKKREIRALIKASEELRCPNLVIIGNEDKEEEVEWFGTKRKIKFISLWKWLLENNDSEN